MIVFLLCCGVCVCLGLYGDFWFVLVVLGGVICLCGVVWFIGVIICYIV